MSFVSSYSPSYHSIGGLVSPNFDQLSHKLSADIPSSNFELSVASPPQHENDFSQLPLPSTPQIATKNEAKIREIHPLHYHKLKMNYFRRLNVIPILTTEDVCYVMDQKKSVSEKRNNPSLQEKPKKPSMHEGAQRKAKSIKSKPSISDTDRFVPSFLPSRSQTSSPIAIPPRKNRSGSSHASDDDSPRNDEKQTIIRSKAGAFPGSQITTLAFTPKAPISVPDVFGVFDQGFEL